MNRRRCGRAIGVWLLAAGSVQTVDAQVLLRDGRGEMAGEVIRIGPGGVELRMEVGGRSVTRQISHDRIRSVAGEPVGASAALLAIGEDLWRARTRLERGDWLAAEPALESARERLRTEDDQAAPKGARITGPTGAVLEEGMLRCRLARGARAGAIGSWLGLIRVYEESSAIGQGGVRRPETWVGGMIEGPPVLDPLTALVPALPPIWVGEPSLDVAGAAGDWLPADAGAAAPMSVELAAWYTVAAGFESRADPAPRWPVESSEAEGVRLVRAIVQARAGDAGQRRTARESLSAVLARDNLDGWTEAWCRAAIGRSLLLEDEREQKIRGVIQLLHIPARLESSSRHLVAVCLAEAAVAMWDLGDAQAAVALRDELLTRCADHPATGWSRLQEIRSGGGAVPALAPKTAARSEGSP